MCAVQASSSNRPESGLQRLTLVDNTRVELDCHRGANDLAEETGRVAGIVCCWGGGGGGAVGSWGGHFRGVFLVVWMDLIGRVLCFFCVFLGTFCYFEVEVVAVRDREMPPAFAFPLPLDSNST